MRCRFESAVRDTPPAFVHPDEPLLAMINAEKAGLEFGSRLGVLDLTFLNTLCVDLWLDRPQRLRKDNRGAIVEQREQADQRQIDGSGRVSKRLYSRAHRRCGYVPICCLPDNVSPSIASSLGSTNMIV